MNWQLFESNWKQFRGTVRARWGKLHDEHLDVIAGNREKLVSKIQEIYGIQRVDANREVEAFEQRNRDYKPK